MNVFILCTGRCGSKSIIEACQYVDKYTAGHETRSQLLLENRLDYPINHIEADNRLTWFLGGLDKKYGDNAYYVHLLRNEEDTVNSFTNRWRKFGILSAFAEGIHMTNRKDKEVIKDYYKTVNENIVHFLKDKSKVLTINIEDIEYDFKRFWEFIDASGEYQKALDSIMLPKNTSKSDQSIKSKFKRLLFDLKN